MTRVVKIPEDAGWQYADYMRGNFVNGGHGMYENVNASASEDKTKNARMKMSCLLWTFY